ncbi:hypothetical protein HD554DRAFT_2026816 [Boletus coccyginus]|nr:hypothetical protein HD554DRAFT_2026816 [Boletus coccyginus]
MLTCIQDQDANIPQVSEELATKEFIRLACHWIPDWKHPFESRFAFGDRLLKVENIVRYDLQNSQFLVIRPLESPRRVRDEAINPAAAMQFAGFRSVIGTMWAHTQAVLALDRTMNSLRSSEVTVNQRIPYIHFGA